MVPAAQNVWLCAVAIFVTAAFGCAPLQRSGSNIVSVNLGEDWQRADRLNQKGIKHLRDQQPHLAKAQFRQAIQVNEGHGGAHNNLGLIHYRCRDLYPAATEFQKAIEYMPHNASPVNNLGMALEAAGRVDEAIELYRQANEMEPTNALFLGNLVRARIRSGCQDELVIQQLKDLLLYDDRCDWVDWAKEQLEIHLNPYLDRGPSTPESPLSTDSTDDVNDPPNRSLVETPPTPDSSAQYWDGNPTLASPIPQPQSQPMINEPIILDSHPDESYEGTSAEGNSILELSPPSRIYEEIPAPREPSKIQQQSAQVPINNQLNDLVELQVGHLD